MSDENDHRIKRVDEVLEDLEERIYKMVRIGSESKYSPPTFDEVTDNPVLVGTSLTGESNIYCNCHTVCGCDTVSRSNCGCHNVCTCDNVCTCNSHETSSAQCTCNTVEYCTCNAVCTCHSYSCSCNVDSHYWYPN